ncbi:hypothetical protein [Ruegeria hyattellae]|uniref:hypothetical protein n=1 Tax=Ruegeria hyattellae TaxID=3233337 RepID=UPI00355B9005
MRFVQLAFTAGGVVFAAAVAHADVSTETHDLNQDGVVTFEEMLEYHPAGIDRTQEFIDRHRIIFDGADTNGDGVVDASENQGIGAGKTKVKGAKKS